MRATKQQLWQRFQKYYSEYPDLGLALDLSRMNFPDDFFSSLEPAMQRAFNAMEQLEKGAIANPDEQRMVGHYWLRNSALAPTHQIRLEIENTLAAIRSFAEKIHQGSIKGNGGPFQNLLLIGIGGSALGPQFVTHALSQPGKDKLQAYFFDNTDPDGMDRVLAALEPELGQTLCVTISKSGGTKETRNGMLEAKAAYERAGLSFSNHAVAITSVGSQLDQTASSAHWLARFPMWDWVGGRTSELSVVGLLPAALQGFDIDAMLEGARICDEVTRKPVTTGNPAALLAAMWFYIGNGKGEKNMVILPYKDRFELLAKYLQQLIMESLGKGIDLDGKQVMQGLTVLGNKGATDQHSYIQQLRDGLDNFFVLFIEVLRDRVGKSLLIEEAITSGDYLEGFYLGTRQALHENGRESVTVIVNEASPFIVGTMIALFERTVGLYASLININPYHQPGVEAGKKAAANVIDLQRKILQILGAKQPLTIEQIAERLNSNEEVELIFKICQHLSANPDRGIRRTAGKTPFEATYQQI